MKINQHIEIVRSTTTYLSSMSQSSCDAILRILTKNYARVGVTTVNSVRDLESLVNNKPDLVFLGMKYVPDEDTALTDEENGIWLSGYFKEHGIAYTGSGSQAHELELDKTKAKRRVLEMGLTTSPYFETTKGVRLNETDFSLNYPLFVKPTNRGGGFGIDSQSLVHNFEQLISKVDSLTAELDTVSLIEEYLPGREFSVAILKDEYSPDYITMPIELIAPLDENGVRILSAQVKSADAESHAEITDAVLRLKVSDLAIRTFHALGARDYGRIDIRLNRSGIPQFLEANLIPSLIDGYGNFPKACLMHKQMGFEEMILYIVRLGLARKTEYVAEDSVPDDLLNGVLSRTLMPA